MIQLIPAIDIIQGQCVRLCKGDYDTKRVYGSPLDMALQFQDLGFNRLHLVDLDGAKASHVVNISVLEEITQKTRLEVDFGGGVKTDDDLRRAFDSGASLVTVGSIAVTKPELYLEWLSQYGPQRLILGADVRNGQVSINGWLEDSSLGLNDFLTPFMQAGNLNVLCTDISRDGMLQGPSTPLYRQLMADFPQCHLIASGGVSSIEDISTLDQAGIPAVVFGKAIYEGRIDMKLLAERFLTSNP
ncbi:MAG: 1-(5-phosphoribosyl)-5-[(5-phosphoribosylamino)methylideneamino]imidazole-4-carboxamide isomerase [Bacteroidaceae bacterium]|nr:1-(5-phosphoribosyl)-5-[(5-phosphoribosylamino)methylideneamino]imidazole-4-carboxamide isomerase [Bacteroidaceae bacterium]